MDNIDKVGHPTITLKKGKTELKIENASAVIKKINELYPPENIYSWPSNNNVIKREVSEKEKERQKKWMCAAKNWFKTEMFGGTEDFEVIVTENSTDQNKYTLPESYYQYDTTNPIWDNKLKTHQQSSISSVNKNAYEIRSDILKMTFEWASYNDKKLSPEEIVDVARKFYSFVENKRY